MLRRILVIDDEEVLAKNIKRYLDRHGFDTVIAATGREGLQRFAQGDIHLVLLDINLPDVHGFDVLDEIRHRDMRVIVVCVTGSGSAQVATDAMRAGAHDHVSKPLRLSELKILLETRLSQGVHVVDGLPQANAGS